MARRRRRRAQAGTATMPTTAVADRMPGPPEARNVSVTTTAGRSGRRRRADESDGWCARCSTRQRSLHRAARRLAAAVVESDATKRQGGGGYGGQTKGGQANKSSHPSSRASVRPHEGGLHKMRIAKERTKERERHHGDAARGDRRRVGGAGVSTAIPSTQDRPVRPRTRSRRGSRRRAAQRPGVAMRLNAKLEGRAGWSASRRRRRPRWWTRDGVVHAPCWQASSSCTSPSAGAGAVRVANN
jgi:hypothetical protein